MYHNLTNQRPPVQVRIEKPIFIAGKAAAVGDIVSVSYSVAQELRMMNKVTILVLLGDVSQ